LYSNKLKTKWNKKFTDIQLGDALRIFQADIKPQWFFKKLKELGKIKEKLLELPITDPFYCFIVNFNSEIWRPIYQRNAILRIENDCLLKILMEQYDDINNAMDIVFEKYNPNFEPSTKIELNSDLEDLYKNYCKIIMKSWLLEWINPPTVNLESHYVFKYIYHPLDTVLDGLLQYFHLHSSPEHPAKCIVERKRWHHQPPFRLSLSAFNQAEVTERNIISDEITNYGQIQLILLRFNSERLRFTWLAREAMIPTSFENHDVGSMIEIYLIVKEIMKENYEVILKIIQEIESNSSQEGSIQTIEYLQEVI
ncbi:11954_t:CDS:2, partial [Gigaspora margarita]